MKTSGAMRKKPSQRPPGSAHAAVVQPPPLSPVSAALPSACSRGDCSSCSASSTPASAGSGVEELCIPFVPADPDLVALAPAEGGVALPRHLREHPLAGEVEVELDEIAEELDEQDLALGGVRAAGAVGIDLHRCCADGDQRLVADGAIRPRNDARAQIVLSGDDEPVAVPLDDSPTNDVVVAHEAGDELRLGPRR